MKAYIASHHIPKPTKQGLLLARGHGKKRKKIEATITLTSLIDAFVIIVLYLVICNSPSQETIDLEDQINLPQAKVYNQLDGSPVITFKQNQFFIEGKMILEKDLIPQLQKLTSSFSSKVKNTETSIILQADENIEFNKLQPFLTASAHAGIKNVKFAVHQQD